jgi:L-cysteine:1D-myo-inositol 2-amino-2-deoxy-alpha-D-glucopyranoside ligase
MPRISSGEVLTLYDTRRRRMVPFRPRAKQVTMYVCGVTPYDTTHLGHARTFLVFDLLARLLEARDTSVKYAQNVTDIDESILQRADRDGLDWRELGRREERTFLADMRALGWRRPDVMPHATREIPAMLRLAERLESAGHAYRPPGGGLYYDVSTFPRFGEISHLTPAKMRSINASQDDAALDATKRRSPLDFALWRAVPSGPTWPSPFGRGRPGWHLECSAMSERYLGLPIDIHGGGSDLVYPHHECETAQSEAAHTVPFVRYWVHVAPVYLGGRKMSKSLGNMIFVRKALETTSPQAIRLYLFDVHYRRRVDHDEAGLARAGERASELAASLGRGAVGPLGRDAATRAVMAALDDDLDTGRAIRLLEREACRAPASAKPSLRFIARRLLGVA